MPGCFEIHPPSRLSIGLAHEKEVAVTRLRRPTRRFTLAATAVTLTLVGALALPSAPRPAVAADKPASGKKALRVAYSDWPGWVAFEVGIQKGWFKEAGVDVEFSW